MKKKGFTLVELITVITVMIILVAVGFITLDPYKAVKLDAAAKKVAMDLRYAQNLALSTVKWLGISFEADPLNTYTVYQTDGMIDSVIENPSELGKDFIVDLFDYFGGVKISNVNFGGGNKIEFNPLGVPYDDKNGSTLTEEAVVALSYRGLAKEIRITPNTGRVYIQ